ncbi:hypothetical protein [Paenibacillus sp. WLX2291]|uniref:hypothetical protein n=1 Tax=Paenibacillus sp. WLX2291 TaxID=3296934 RepID=UPI0039840132
MPTSFTVVIVIFAVVLIIINVSKSKSQQQGRRAAQDERFFRKHSPPPAHLVPPGHPCEPLAHKLLQSLPAHYDHQLRQRILTEHPELSRDEYEWRWFEMKRYLLLCALFREVPMFSDKVDSVWHEMLMFTRDYQQFCEQFYGYMLHHSPHGGKVSLPDQRALFDWAYAELFPMERANSYLWGSFFRFPLSKSTINELLMFHPNQQGQWTYNRATFEHSPEAKQAILYLNQRFQAHNQAVLQGNKPGDHRNRTANHNSSSDSSSSYTSSYYSDNNYGLGTAAAACVYYSALPPADFCSSINSHLPTDVQQQHSQATSHSSSACGTGSSGSDYNSGHSGGHHSNHSDHSGSSCSSSSCSSSSCSSGSSCSSCSSSS